MHSKDYWHFIHYSQLLALEKVAFSYSFSRHGYQIILKKQENLVNYWTLTIQIPGCHYSPSQPSEDELEIHGWANTFASNSESDFLADFGGSDPYHLLSWLNPHVHRHTAPDFPLMTHFNFAISLHYRSRQCLILRDHSYYLYDWFAYFIGLPMSEFVNLPYLYWRSLFVTRILSVDSIVYSDDYWLDLSY